MEEEKK